MRRPPLPARAPRTSPVRRAVLLAAAVPLLFAPSAFAADHRPDRATSVCRVPDVDLGYDTSTFTALVSLPASGCASREHTMFSLSAAISRVADQDGRDMTQRSVTCGPFRSESDFDNDDAPRQYVCNLAV